MKPQTYLRLSLLLPYVVWIVLILLTLILGGIDEGSLLGQTTTFLGVWIVSVYLIGILFWLIPYTLLSIGLLLWSREKQANTIVRIFALSPLLLTLLILLELNIFSIAAGSISSYLSPPNFENMMALNGLTVIFTLAAGSLCVAIGFGIYRLLQRLRIIGERETELEAGSPETIGTQKRLRSITPFSE